jgi:hypothetical protein
MNRLVVKFKDGTHTNIDCAEMHEDEGIIKVYNNQCQLVAIFDEKEILAAYISRRKE